MKELIKLVHKERMEICRVCPFNSKIKDPKALIESCTKCGCPLVTKTKALTVGCPEGKWQPILTVEEKAVYEEKIKEQNSKTNEG